MMSCTALTPQEEWIDEGLPREAGRERIYRKLENLRNSPPRISIDRARLFTESFKTTEGQPISLRWAKAMKYVAENISLYIGEDDLIVGRGDGLPGRHGILYPELDGCYMSDMKGNISSREKSGYMITDEMAEIISQEIAPFWAGKTYTEAYARALPEETRRLIFGDNPQNTSNQVGIAIESTTLRASLNWNHDYEKVIKRGIKDIKKQAMERLASMGPVEFAQKGPYLEAVIITCDAIVIWAQRYAKLAMEMAAQESNPERKQELLEMAEVCNWVPENPARNFYEAIQCHWFVHIFSRLEQSCGVALGNARMDQHLYPYYKKDIAEGRITPEKARLLFESVWLNMAENIIVSVSASGASIQEGYAHFESVVVGGKNRNGEDATNELSYMILESKRGLPINYPDLSVRIHARTPAKFLHHVSEIIKEGQGFPKLFNDEEIIPLYLSKGMALEDALDYCASGCTETRVLNHETYINGGVFTNMAAILEMALNNGRIKVLGNAQFGLETGDPREFTTFDQVMDAFRKQYQYILKHIIIQQTVADMVKPKYMAAPLTSMLNDISMEQCIDLNGGLEGGFREAYIDAVGFGTVIDSLAAIKKLVYDDKKIPMSELLDALDVNFEGKEAVRQMCVNAPKFGNDDPYVDTIGRQVEEIITSYLKNIRGPHGLRYATRMVPVTNHVPMGKLVSATPNGRKAGIYLSEGTAPSHGADVKGPTSCLISSSRTKNSGSNYRAARLFNQKLSPGSVTGEEGTRKLMSLIRTWCDLKLWHIQFNIINRDTLIAAQKDPDKYRNLIIRVAGYSAYFTDLSEELQNEIINRTEQVF